jgi:hypothetical protein
MTDLRHVLEQIKQAQRKDREKNAFPATLEARAKVAPSEHGRIQTIIQARPTFHVTPSMLCMDEIKGQTPSKNLA